MKSLLPLAASALFLLAACSGPCKSTPGGACTSDSDCVLARCVDAACASCGCGQGFAKSRVGHENPCLIANGSPTPSECKGPPVGCDCIQIDCTKVSAVCVNGQCATQGP